MARFPPSSLILVTVGLASTAPAPVFGADVTDEVEIRLKAPEVVTIQDGPWVWEVVVRNQSQDRVYVSSRQPMLKIRREGDEGFEVCNGALWNFCLSAEEPWGAYLGPGGSRIFQVNVLEMCGQRDHRSLPGAVSGMDTGTMEFQVRVSIGQAVDRGIPKRESGDSEWARVQVTEAGQNPTNTEESVVQ